MDVQNLIKGTAKVIRITSLEKGNVVKYVADETYSPSIKYGIVTDILQNGEKAVIELVTLNHSYSDYKLEYKVLTDKTENIALFPASPQEIYDHFDSIKEAAIKEIQEKEEELDKKKSAFTRLQNLLSESKKQITSPEVKIEQ